MYIKVKVRTEAKEEKIEKVKEDTFHVSLKEKAKNNKANERLLEIFRSLYPNRDIRLVAGHHSPSKILSIDTA
jgi:uncharacterized protein YggU (UPF0235/DUF167 family)